MKTIIKGMITWIISSIIILVLSLMFSSCTQVSTNSLLSPLEIGQKYEEGVIFYLFQEGDEMYIEGEQHGLIVSNDLGTYSWGCTNIPLDLFGHNGYDNTDIIVAYCGTENSAGKTISNGWWLPSIEEWRLLIASNAVSMNISKYYWTSTKASYLNAYAIRLSDGDIMSKLVSNPLQTWGIQQF